MKHRFYILLLIILSVSTAIAQVGIGTTTPDDSAILEIESSDKGFLPPRMSTTQRDGIQGATAGLVIYNTTSSTLEYSDGTNWVDLINNFTSPVVGTEPAASAGGGVGIGTDIPNVNALLDLNVSNLPASEKKGFLPPRMSPTERDDISNPAEGLIVYNKDDNCLNVYLGECWFNLCTNISSTDVFSTKTCQVWMDRNLGATAVTQTLRSDYPDIDSYVAAEEDSFGDLYQWGRSADGHESRQSLTIDGDDPNNRPDDATDTGVWDGLFITSNDGNWLTNTGTNNNLWDGVNGINNPCPAGYRVPTESELNAERITWTSTDDVGAFNSPLRLPRARERRPDNGEPIGGQIAASYWTSTPSGDEARILFFAEGFAFMSTQERGFGYSVRCIKE